MEVKEYFLAGQKHDMRIRLFGTHELLVRSIVLKAQSAFFRKFLDSPEEQIPSGAEYKCEWVSEVEEDGVGWHVVEVNAKRHSYAIRSKLQRDQVRLFMDIINALYKIAFTITPDSLYGLTNLADYYCCLPALSRDLSDCIPMSGGFIKSLYRNVYRRLLIEVTYKLHHAPLFRECAILIAGQLETGTNGPPFKESVAELNPAIQAVLIRMHNRINTLVAQVGHDVLQVVASSKESVDGFSRTMKFWRAKPMYIPEFYHDLAMVDSNKRFKTALAPLWVNNLVFHHRLHPGSFGFHLNVFCGTLSDEELPWDRNQTDW